MGQQLPSQEYRESLYVLKLPEVDELMGLLFEATHCNRPLFITYVNDDRRRLYYDRVARTLFGSRAVSNGDVSNNTVDA